MLHCCCLNRSSRRTSIKGGEIFEWFEVLKKFSAKVFFHLLLNYVSEAILEILGNIYRF